jgi:putative ABC transport system permease protein
MSHSSVSLAVLAKQKYLGELASTLAVLVAELRSHPARAALGVLAIALGVAMGYAVHLINESALAEFSHAMRSLMGNADLEIRGPRSGFDESLYPRLVRLPEVAAASPVVEVEAKVPGQREPLRVLGIDALRAGPVHAALIPSVDDATKQRGNIALFDSDAIFLSPAAFAWLGRKPGEALLLQVGLTALPLRIAGSVPTAGAGQRLAVMDIGAAQWRFQRLGLLSRIDLRLHAGVDEGSFRRHLATLLPPGVVALSPAEAQRRTSNVSRAYRVNLNVLALVALFTGSFLVFSSQALSVVRRRAQLALLRVLGVTRGGIETLLLVEGCVVGVAGSALGLALGYLAALLVLENFGADLGGGYFHGVTPEVRVQPIPTLMFFALGIAAALAGSLLPAREAARAKPAQALKAGDEESALAPLRSLWHGLVLMLAGAALAAAGPVAGLPLAGYGAIAMLLVGGISLTPRLAHTILARLPPGKHPVAGLALAQLAGAPGRASVGISGIVASFSLMVAMAIMVASFRDSVDQWLTHILPADLYLRAASAGETGFFSPADVRRIESTAGVARAEFLRVDQITLDPERPPVALITRAIDPSQPATRLPLTGDAILPRPGDPHPIWVSEAMLDLYGFTPGKIVTLPLAGRQIPFLVAGVWRDYARQHGAIVLTQADYRSITGDELVSDAALWLMPDLSIEALTERLRSRLPNGNLLEFAVPRQIRAVTLHIFDRSFAVTYLLEAVAIVIGLTGVATSFGAQALARSREFGMLRHIGLTRAQVGGMLLLEGALLAVLGAAMGLALGAMVSVILIRVVNPQSFHWTMDMHAPWGWLAALALTLIVSAAATAVASGRRAMSVDAVRAVREDW